MAGLGPGVLRAFPAGRDLATRTGAPEQLHYSSAVAHVVFKDGQKEFAGEDRDVKLPNAWNQTRRGIGGLVEYVIECAQSTGRSNSR